MPGRLEIELDARVDVESGEPRCLIVWGPQRGSMSPDEMRAHGRLCFEVAEVAVQDAAVFAWAKSMGMEPEPAALLVDALRGFRVETL